MRMKQVWVLNHYAQVPSGSGGTRHYSLASHMRTHGWKATIFAASIEHDTGRQRLAQERTFNLEETDGILFLWLRTPKYRGNGSGRLWNMLVYTWRTLRPVTTRGLVRPDIIIGSSVHPFAALAGAILALRFRVPFIFEVRDLWPQTLIDMGRLSPRSLMTRALQWLELWLYRRADRIIVLLPKAGNYIEPLGIRSNKIVWIPNGVELEDYPAPPAAKQREFFTLMYFGAHGLANGLENLIRAMAILRTRPEASKIRLQLIGEGPLKNNLKQLSLRLGQTNVEFLDPVPKYEIPNMAKRADAFVICVLDRPELYRFGISMNKLFDYLAAARPVVISSNAANNPVAEAGAGITVPPDDPAVLADAILQLASMSPAERELMGRAGRRHVEEHYSYEKLAARLAVTLDQCCKEAR